MEAGRAVSMLSSSSSFTAQLASPSSSSSSSAGSPSIASLCSLPSHTFFVAKTAGHGSHHLFPIMASSESAVSSNGPTTSAQTTPASAIDFLMLCQQLKITKRTGWVKHGLKETESIADHMHRMAVMAIIAAEVPGINKDRCVKMAVVHDIAEAEEMKDLWLEYENNASLEANLVKDFDKVEMILQALEYETTHGMVLNEFYESTAGKFQTDLGKAWAAEIIRRRKKRIDPTKQ